MAESQHEIVMLLLRKKEFVQAAAEADKIFQMDWPATEESRLLKDMLGFSGEFQRHEQPALGLQLLEKNMRVFKTPKSQAAILKEMGYLNKKLGNDDKALECFRRAQQLEKSSPD
jgi:tetratricopeptide (TPR) repeat protein